jgi:DDE superfamily endonuclease
MQKPTSPLHEHLTNLAAFRQAVYGQVFTRRRDAQFELLDALLLSPPISSFPDLSLSPGFERTWHSAYAALEDGRQDQDALRRLLVAQLPHGQQGQPLVFALDGTTWPRPAARCLPDRQYCHSPTVAVLTPSIVVGIPYSVLAWVPHSHSSWAPPLAVDAVPATQGQGQGQGQDALSVGLDQLRTLWQLRPADAGPWIVAADGSYSCVRFWQGVRTTLGPQDGLVTRLRRDRVLYRGGGPYSGRGRPRKHGPRFACADPTTWGTPTAQQLLTDPHWGQVSLRYWGQLHDRKDTDGHLGVLQVSVHQERATPPEPLWLSWHGPNCENCELQTIWRAYEKRWSIEASLHFRKAVLAWTTPQVQTAEAMSVWTVIVTVALWVLYLGRGVVEAKGRPWQRVSATPTPSQVRAGVGGIIMQLGSPARRPRPRGKAPGWPKGRPRTRRPRQRVVKKTPKRVRASAKAA